MSDDHNVFEGLNDKNFGCIQHATESVIVRNYIRTSTMKMQAISVAKLSSVNLVM